MTGGLRAGLSSCPSSAVASSSVTTSSSTRCFPSTAASSIATASSSAAVGPSPALTECTIAGLPSLASSEPLASTSPWSTVSGFAAGWHLAGLAFGGSFPHLGCSCIGGFGFRGARPVWSSTALFAALLASFVRVP